MTTPLASSRSVIAVAEFERGTLRDRVNAGIATAKQPGVHLGRPHTLQGRQAEVVKLKTPGLWCSRYRKAAQPVGLQCAFGDESGGLSNLNGSQDHVRLLLLEPVLRVSRVAPPGRVRGAGESRGSSDRGAGLSVVTCSQMNCLCRCFKVTVVFSSVHASFG
jgi:hypothetical protein